MMRLFGYIFILLMTFSCILPEEMHDAVVSDGETVEVTLSLDMLKETCIEMTGSEIITKAIIDPSGKTQTSELIKNFWVIQYDGTDDNALLVGEPKYFDDYQTFAESMQNGGNEGKLNLVASTDEATLFILANTFDSKMTFPLNTSLAMLKERSRDVTDHLSVLATDGENRYPVFCGVWKGTITEGETIGCVLKRNVAKASLTIIPSDGVTVQSWQIRSVPSLSYYYTDYDSNEIFPTPSLETVDYPLQSGSALSAEVYLPVNQKGTVSEVTSEAYKNYYAPINATYLQVNTVCDGTPVVYSFYLGSNFSTDFNILPNHTYSYTFKIDGKGDPSKDTRVSYPDIVDYAGHGAETANCYIINPGKTDEVRYRIPVKRVDEFWGGINGYEDKPEYTLGTARKWEVEILTTNFDNTTSRLYFTKNTGTGCYNTSLSEMEYFEVAVRPNTAGSAIVAIREASEGDSDPKPILWSWHLWITGYAPDEAYRNSPQTGVYAYGVTGGYVHRYEGTVWHEAYAKRFIMDRNLGAFSNRHCSVFEDGSIYYQYGRKDPFLGNLSYGFKAYGTEPIENHINSEDPTESVVYSIQNPLKYFTSKGWESWSKGNKYNPEKRDATLRWMDPFTSTQTYKTMAIEKSIFDPCPPGYCLPTSNIWEDFRDQTEKEPTTNINAAPNSMTRDFPAYDSAPKGLYYWPYPADGMSTVIRQEELVYYPMTGIRQPTNAMSQNETLYCLSTNIGSTINHVSSMSSNSDAISKLRADIGMNMAQPVRCITLYDAE